MNDERRQSPRQKAFLKGRINNGLGDVDCLIRDLSATGAKLMFSGGITMPGIIDLQIPTKKQTIRAKVQWRNGDEMGVSFLEDTQAAPAPAYAPSVDAELTERVAKLETEIAALRKMLARLRPEIFPNPDLAEAG
ncbi:MAG: PilZ domain-containing protein [Pseudomonadota bacterium]|nr:PilZ domain-containing protein [Pseudomonadota bacterium]